MPKLYAVRKCAICGNDVPICHRKRLALEFNTCSSACRGLLARKKPNAECKTCGKKLHRKPSLLVRNRLGMFCDAVCAARYKILAYAGENNPNYGNRGDSNPLYKGERILHANYYYVYAPEHPFCEPTMKGRIREHRLVAEQHHLTEENSVIVDGKRYLSPDYDVHHKNEDKLDNRPENLEVMTRAAHAALHHRLRAIRS